MPKLKTMAKCHHMGVSINYGTNVWHVHFGHLILKLHCFKWLWQLVALTICDTKPY